MKEKLLSLDSILLFVLIIPIIMAYRISPATTPYWLFGLVFLGLLSYIVLDLIKLHADKYNKYKNICLLFLVTLVIGGTFISAIVVRHQTHPIYNIHDIILQQEAAIRFLLDGKNPYATSYFGTFLEEWHYSATEVNPALYHFVMEPFYLLFALPFYFISNHTIGYFDGRIPLLVLFVFLLSLAFFIPKEQERKRLFVILLAFNPGMFAYILEGRSDIFMYAFLFAGFYLLHIKQYVASGIPLALAFAVKQSAWPILPLYLAFIFFKKNLRETFKTLVVFVIVFLVIVLPFYVWNQKAFLDSTVNYLSGQTEHSYPISGYGFGQILNQMGVIKDVHSYFPFTILQLIVGVPILIVLIKFLKTKPSLPRLIIAYGIFLFIFWYFSRYFNNSHLGFLSMIFVTAYFWDEEK